MITNNWYCTHKALLICLFLLLLGRIGVGQQDIGSDTAQVGVENLSAEAIAAQHLQKLKEGVLVVRLRSDRKKIEKVEEFIERSDDPDEKVENQFLLNEILGTQKRYEESFRNAMGSDYSFSEYLYMYDYQTPEFIQGQVEFFTQNDSIIKMDTYGNRDFYVLSEGTSEFNNSEILEILDQNLTLIPDPFPSTVSITVVQELFSLFTGNDLIKDKIIKLNKKLLKANYINSSE